jgi:preprotein translocase subunit SecA
MRSLKIPEGEAIEARMVTRSIENAQRKVEARNFDIRKQLLEFDDVANDQRKVIYQQRNELLESKDISETIRSIRATCSARRCRSSSRRRASRSNGTSRAWRRSSRASSARGAGGRLGRGRHDARRPDARAR